MATLIDAAWFVDFIGNSLLDLAEGEPYGPGTQLTSIRVSAAESR